MIGHLTPTDSITHAILDTLEKNRSFLDSTGTVLRSVEIIVKMDLKNGGAGLALLMPTLENNLTRDREIR